MEDLIYLGLFAARCGATIGLIILCERLMPRNTPGGGKP